MALDRGTILVCQDIDSRDEDEETIDFKEIKKTLDFETDEKLAEKEEHVETTIDSAQDHMCVYLRVRPFSENEKNKGEDQDCMEITSEHSMVMHAPEESHTYKNSVRGTSKAHNKFTFSRIFPEDTSQKEFFDDTMLGRVKEFIDGQNCLIFTYGVTNSGKTYTIQGNPNDAGILTRSLDVIFNSIAGKQLDDVSLKPKLFCDVTRLTPGQSEKELAIKDSVLKLADIEEPDMTAMLGPEADASVMTVNSTMSEDSLTRHSIASVASSKHSLDKTSLEDIFEASRIREEATVDVQLQGPVKFSIWVSFMEIYNDQIFDLLDPPPKKKTMRRNVLHLKEDRHGVPYVRGLKEICVSNADEAYKVMTIGKKNLQIACTKLNHNSSRSHCVFTVKMLRVVNKENPKMARISMLSFCDLAGSERNSKTQSHGERMKEAGNINTSLLTLGRCIKTLRHNQIYKDNPRIVPFRDSKLTRLFQSFFCGKGRASMVVNVNQCASLFDETLHALKYSAIAKQVIVVQEPEKPAPEPERQATKKRRVDTLLLEQQSSLSRDTIGWATPGTMVRVFEEEERAVALPLPDDSDEEGGDEEYLDIIEDLKQQLLQEKRKNRKLEREIRAEVSQEMAQQLVMIEETYSERMREALESAEDKHEKKLEILTKSIRKTMKRKRVPDQNEDDEYVPSVTLHATQVTLQEREKELQEVKTQLVAMEKRLADMVTEQQSVQEKCTKLSFENSSMREQLQEATGMMEELQTLYAEMQTQLGTAEERLRDRDARIAQLEGALTHKGNHPYEPPLPAPAFAASTQTSRSTRGHIDSMDNTLHESPNASSMDESVNNSGAPNVSCVNKSVNYSGNNSVAHAVSCVDECMHNSVNNSGVFVDVSCVNESVHNCIVNSGVFVDVDKSPVDKLASKHCMHVNKLDSAANVCESVGSDNNVDSTNSVAVANTSVNVHDVHVEYNLNSKTTIFPALIDTSLPKTCIQSSVDICSMDTNPDQPKRTDLDRVSRDSGLVDCSQRVHEHSSVHEHLPNDISRSDLADGVTVVDDSLRYEIHGNKREEQQIRQYQETNIDEDIEGVKEQDSDVGNKYVNHPADKKGNEGRTSDLCDSVLKSTEIQDKKPQHVQQTNIDTSLSMFGNVTTTNTTSDSVYPNTPSTTTDSVYSTHLAPYEPDEEDMTSQSGAFTTSISVGGITKRRNRGGRTKSRTEQQQIEPLWSVVKVNRFDFSAQASKSRTSFDFSAATPNNTRIGDGDNESSFQPEFRGVDTSLNAASNSLLRTPRYALNTPQRPTHLAPVCAGDSTLKKSPRYARHRPAAGPHTPRVVGTDSVKLPRYMRANVTSESSADTSTMKPVNNFTPNKYTPRKSRLSKRFIDTEPVMKSVEVVSREVCDRDKGSVNGLSCDYKIKSHDDQLKPRDNELKSREQEQISRDNHETSLVSQSGNETASLSAFAPPLSSTKYVDESTTNHSPFKLILMEGTDDEDNENDQTLTITPEKHMPDIGIVAANSPFLSVVNDQSPMAPLSGPKARSGSRKAKIAVRLNRASKLRLNSPKCNSPKNKRRKFNVSVCSDDLEPWPPVSDNKENQRLNTAGKIQRSKGLNVSRNKGRVSVGKSRKSVGKGGKQSGKGLRNFISRILK